MPHDTAATWPVSGVSSISPLSISHPKAWWSATQAPVIAAVRVPPSARSTSQSTVIWRSPKPSRSVTARSERPISRWISWVRPLCLPRAASRSVRLWVERGSMPYSAVTQPRPVLRRKGGTRPITEAAHRTWVPPKRTRQEPSAWPAQPASSVTARIASRARPDGLPDGFPDAFIGRAAFSDRSGPAI